MKVYKDLYKRITSPQNLFEAWDTFKRDKRNRPDVEMFENDVEHEVFTLAHQLSTESYRHGPYYGFWIRDPKIRRIHKATVRDRVVHHALFKILNPVFEPTFIATSFSCREGKGTHKGVEYVARALRSVSKNAAETCFVLKCDVRKFFDSIDQETLLEILRGKIADQKTFRLLRNVIASYATGANERERVLMRREKGYPSGT